MFFFLLSFQTNNKVIRGKLITHHPKYRIAHVQVRFYNQQHFLVGQSYTDEQGHFLCCIKNESKVGYICYKGIGFAETYLSSYPTGENLLIISVPVPLKIDSLGKTICPMCLRSDETKRIIPGESIRTVRSSFFKRSISDDSVYYSGTCVFTEQDPLYYCERDAIKF